MAALEKVGDVGVELAATAPAIDVDIGGVAEAIVVSIE
jgi:hypothetical protein